MIKEIIISEIPLETNCDQFSDDSIGAWVEFVGVVRAETESAKVEKLVFEAYESMALSELNKIADEIAHRWAVRACIIRHRVGTLHVGEAPVYIAIGTSHRGAAFEACQYAIDKLKSTVPIWKREHFEDGSVWVSAHP